MKNCAPALSGLPGTVTAATEPRVIFGARASAFTAFSPPVPYAARFDGILRQRIAALHHSVQDHPVKDRAVVAALGRDLHEVRGLIRRRLGRQVDDERAGGRLDDRLLRRSVCANRVRLKPDTTYVTAASVEVTTDQSSAGFSQTIAKASNNSTIVSSYRRLLRRVDDSRRVPDVVEGRDERDRQRRLHEHVEQDASGSRGS